MCKGKFLKLKKKNMGLCDGSNSWKEEKKKRCADPTEYIGSLVRSHPSMKKAFVRIIHRHAQKRHRLSIFFPPSSSSMPAVPFSRSLFHLLLHPARLFFFYLETFAGESVMWPPTCGTYFIGLLAQGPGTFLFKRNKYIEK